MEEIDMINAYCEITNVEKTSRGIILDITLENEAKLVKLYKSREEKKIKFETIDSNDTFILKYAQTPQEPAVLACLKYHFDISSKSILKLQYNNDKKIITIKLKKKCDEEKINEKFFSISGSKAYIGRLGGKLPYNYKLTPINNDKKSVTYIKKENKIKWIQGIKNNREFLIVLDSHEKETLFSISKYFKIQKCSNEPMSIIEEPMDYEVEELENELKIHKRKVKANKKYKYCKLEDHHSTRSHFTRNHFTRSYSTSSQDFIIIKIKKKKNNKKEACVRNSFQGNISLDEPYLNDEYNEPKLYRKDETWKFLSQNVQSIYDNNFRTNALIETIIHNKIDIALIQETWTNVGTLTIKMKHNNGMIKLGDDYRIIADTKYDDMITNNELRGKGTAIIIRSNIHKHLQKTHREPGRFVAIELKVEHKTFLVISILMPTGGANPTKETKNELEKLSKQILEIIGNHKLKAPDSHIIIGGDWNATMNSNIDRIYTKLNGEQERKKIAKPEIQLLRKLDNKDFKDIWRETHPEEYDFSYTAKNKEGTSKSRIDFFLISANLELEVISSEIVTSNIVETECNNHRSVTLEIKAPCKRHKPISHKVPKLIWKECSRDQISKFKDHLDNSMEIGEIKKRLDNTIQWNSEQVDEIFGRLVTEIRKSAKEHLTIKEIRINDPTNPMSKLKASLSFRKECRLVRDMRKKLIQNIPLTVNELIKIKSTINKWETQDKFGANNESTKDKLVETAKLTEIIRLMNIKDRKDRKLKVDDMKKRHAENFKNNIRKTIKNIFNKKNENKTDYLKVKQEDGEVVIITDPEEFKTIVKEKQENVFKCCPRTYNQEQKLRWNKVYEPDKNVKEEWYNPLTKIITDKEVLKSLKDMPRNKAPGETDITYEIWQNSGNAVTGIITKMFNLMLQTGETGQQFNKGIIILLQKIDNWDGQFDKLRPITLLETLRKVFTRIINDRLTEILDKHKILKGYNFGFRRGKSCADVLNVYRNIKDIANHNKWNLYMIMFDVAKAYDTVPRQGMVESMRRLKIPEKIIRVIMNMDENRSLCVKTHHGNTDTFRPEIGLPQGDILSPLLWAIFYDPLLVKLQEKNYGIHFNDEITVANFAYADDLTIISTVKEHIQELADIVFDFLNMHGMKINVNKCEAMTNKNRTDEDFYEKMKFTINGEEITNIKDGNEIFRILGVFDVLGTNQKLCIDYIKDKTKKSVNILSAKYTPGTITTYIINNVIISQLLYRLQVTPMSNTELESFDRIWMEIVKKKCCLPKNHINEEVWFTQSGNLKKFSEVFDERLLNTANVLQRDQDLPGIVQRTTLRHFSYAFKLKFTDLFSTPLQIGKSNKYLIPFISSRLLENQLQLRTLSQRNGTHNLHLCMEMNEFNEVYNSNNRENFKELNKIMRIDDVIANNGTKMISFNKYSQRPEQKSLLQRYIKGRRGTNSHNNQTIPKFFRAIQDTLAENVLGNVNPEDEIEIKDEHLALNNFLKRDRESETINLRTSKRLKQEDKNTIKWENRFIEPYPIAKTDEVQHIELWTDGSSKLKPKVMGAAAIIINLKQEFDANNNESVREFWKTYNTNCNTYKSSKIEGMQSSTRAELFAIFLGLTACPQNAKIKIYTDSQSSINLIRQILKGGFKTERKKLKKRNVDLIDAIEHLINQFDHKPKIIKVKGHSKQHDRAAKLNDLADKYADLSTKQDNVKQILQWEEDEDYKTTLICNNNDTYACYPSTIIKMINHKRRQTKLIDRFKTKWPNMKDLDDIYITENITINNKGLGKKNYLDASKTKEYAFRVKLKERTLPTMENLNSWMPNNYKDNICRRCKHVTTGVTESENHLWECQITKSNLEVLVERTKQLLKERKLLYKDLKNTKITEEEIIEAANMRDDNFLRRIESRGFTNEHFENRLKRDPKIGKYFKLFSRLIRDCWLTAFYEIIWNERTKLIEPEIKLWIKQKQQEKFKPTNKRKRTKETEELPTENTNLNKKTKIRYVQNQGTIKLIIYRQKEKENSNNKTTTKEKANNQKRRRNEIKQQHESIKKEMYCLRKRSG